jgi:signal transduction histidine kinase
MKDDLNTAERRSYQTVALQQAQRLSRLVGQLLDLGKIDAGQVTLVAEPFQLADLAHEVASKFRLAARKDNIALIVECPESPPLVVADIALIERVLDNLVANALQHTPRGGQIALRLQVRPESIRVDVRDSGRGIAEADRSKIFERFFRGDRSRSSSSGHAGLGLSIVQGILALHGQSIASRNSQSGGAVFEFELPLIRPSSEGVASGLVRDAS